MSTRPFYYWRGVRFSTTSNSQYTAGFCAGTIAANRAVDDQYVRSMWWAELSYGSDGTGGGPPSWWSSANVYFLAQFSDIPGLTHPDPLVSGEPDDRIAMSGMIPDRNENVQFTPAYTVNWSMSRDGLFTEGRKTGTGITFPYVVYGVSAQDYNGYFALAAEPGGIIRCNIWGRVLWQSSVGP